MNVIILVFFLMKPKIKEKDKRRGTVANLLADTERLTRIFYIFFSANKNILQ